MSYYLSRLQLAPNPTTQALKPLLDPQQRGEAMDAHHRLLWTAFAAVVEPPNDDKSKASSSAFLWRSEGKGVFHVLSRHKPEHTPLFYPPETKEFTPQLTNGDKLRFILRVNATKDRPSKHLVEKDGKLRDRRVDIVMNELIKIPSGDVRKIERLVLAQAIGQQWLSDQGRKHGFSLDECVIEHYSVQALPRHRGRRTGQPQFGVLDIKGILTVSDAPAFVAKLNRGFGRAKAFGCGLMMIRRV